MSLRLPITITTILNLGRGKSEVRVASDEVREFFLLPDGIFEGEMLANPSEEDGSSH